MYDIARNIPIPPAKIKAKYPFPDMNPGDSFYVPGDDSIGHNVACAAYAYARRANRKFTVRREGEGYRVWRI